ncbi:MAG TPA: IS21 family transposase [Acidimicrobiales bacterium]|nr:MAG: transposase [Actinobacteria bacterium 21-64-8]HQU00610.1 IS21 family transposase [Acidimicrobiales bacterium]
MAKRSKSVMFEEMRKAHYGPDEVSIRALAEKYGVHRRTVRQALLSAVPPARTVVERTAPVLGPWINVIDGWLESDRTAPKKQRHTARRVHQRLVEEHDAEISESTVRRYVAHYKRRHALPVSEVKISQTHPLGDEAEVDFGQFSFMLDGTMVEAWMFVMRLSASGRAFHFVSFNQAQEVFIEGHVRAFTHFGGVVRRVRYDNLKTAVVRVLKGRSRVESARFTQLRSHYLFDAFFCLPGVEGAHEKGGVEGEIGRFRRRHFVPLPNVSSLSELQELVIEADRLDDARHVDGRHLSVGEHFALEAVHLAPLPLEPFESSLVLMARVDTKSRVCVRQNFYSVPVTLMGRKVAVRLGANQVALYDGARWLATHDRSPGKGREVLDLDHYLETLFDKPGALVGATALASARRSGRFSVEHDAFWSTARRALGDAAGTRALIAVLLLGRTMPAGLVREGLRRVLAVGSVDPALVAIEARASFDETLRPALVADTFARFERALPRIDHYDSLLVAP